MDKGNQVEDGYARTETINAQVVRTLCMVAGAGAMEGLNHVRLEL